MRPVKKVLIPGPCIHFAKLGPRTAEWATGRLRIVAADHDSLGGVRCPVRVALPTHGPLPDPGVDALGLVRHGARCFSRSADVSRVCVDGPGAVIYVVWPPLVVCEICSIGLAVTSNEAGGLAVQGGPIGRSTICEKNVGCQRPTIVRAATAKSIVVDLCAAPEVGNPRRLGASG